MASTKTSRRLRWALLIALGLHLLLAWRYAPGLRTRVAQALQPTSGLVEKVIEISPEPAPPEPARERWSLQPALRGGSPEALPPPLPEGFFPRPTPASSGRLALSGALTPSPRPPEPLPPVEAGAPIVPAVVRLPDIVAISPQARTPKPSASPAPKPAPPLTAARVAAQAQQAA
ncbi:MAG: hypothetical protein Q8Q73_18805, partial [Stagnimonas sp.]|nr:hypothetical protein [Stagnimonas sp.]